MKTRAGQKIRLTSVEELLGVSNEESAMDLEIAKIRPFKDHPFKVVEDESMLRTTESIAMFGVLTPLIARPTEDGKYEIISGHRRAHAAETVGLTEVPVIVRDMKQYLLTTLFNAPVTIDPYYQARVNYDQYGVHA